MAKARSKGARGSGWRDLLTRTLAGGLKERSQILELLREAYQRGLLDADALAMVEGALTMAEMQARDLMVPRACISAMVSAPSTMASASASSRPRW